MLNKRKEAAGKAIRASVQKEMAKPRITRSARIADPNLATSRVPERPSTTAPGIVKKITPSTPSEPARKGAGRDRG
jgi:hypothetical protein